MTNVESEDYYRCNCSVGYVQNTTIQCLDFCEADRDNCDDATTNCVATPGVGNNYRCDCKTGHNRVDGLTCVKPSQPPTEPTTGRSDGKMN